MGSTTPSADTGPFTEFSRLRPPMEAVIRVSPEMVAAADPPQSLVDLVEARLWGGPQAYRMALLYDAVPAFQEAHGISFGRAVESVKIFRRKLCHRVFAAIIHDFPDAINPLGIALDPIEFDLDGYQVNIDFINEGLDFSSNKQAHFDIVEPLGSNLYGPNIGVAGGLPAFSDGYAYCRDHGLKITDVLDKIPGTRNISLVPEHYRPLIEDYSVAFDIDMVHDTPFTVLINRVEEAGLLHGATTVTAAEPLAVARRPIGHYAFDNVTDEAAAQWYAELGQPPTRSPGDTSASKPLIPARLGPIREPRVIRLVPAERGRA